jgi:hypothetical protein
VIPHCHKPSSGDPTERSATRVRGVVVVPHCHKLSSGDPTGSDRVRGVVVVPHCHKLSSGQHWKERQE